MKKIMQYHKKQRRNCENTFRPVLATPVLLFFYQRRVENPAMTTRKAPPAVCKSNSRKQVKSPPVRYFPAFSPLVFPGCPKKG